MLPVVLKSHVKSLSVFQGEFIRSRWLKPQPRLTDRLSLLDLGNETLDSAISVVDEAAESFVEGPEVRLLRPKRVLESSVVPFSCIIGSVRRRLFQGHVVARPHRRWLTGLRGSVEPKTRDVTYVVLGDVTEDGSEAPRPLRVTGNRQSILVINNQSSRLDHLRFELSSSTYPQMCELT